MAFFSFFIWLISIVFFSNPCAPIEYWIPYDAWFTHRIVPFHMYTNDILLISLEVSNLEVHLALPGCF